MGVPLPDDVGVRLRLRLGDLEEEYVAVKLKLGVSVGVEVGPVRVRVLPDREGLLPLALLESDRVLTVAVGLVVKLPEVLMLLPLWLVDAVKECVVE